MEENSNDQVTVLVVDDEPNIVELLTVSLKFQGFNVRSANSGTEALRIAREINPEAYILDVMMPGMDSFELLAKLRAEGLDGPVLYLTAKDSVDQRIHGLTIGADDYVTKPFSLEEVITRLRVILRRGGAGQDDNSDATMSYADLTLNDDTHEVTKGGEEIDLSPTEFNLLRFLMQNKEVVLSKRSEERRVGKECSCGWWREEERKENERGEGGGQGKATDTHSRERGHLRRCRTRD